VKFLRFGMAVAAASMVLAAPAAAADYSYMGTLSDPNEVLLFNFSVGTASDVTLRSYSHSGGTMADGTVIGSGGFDPILALFDGTGILVGQDDDGGPGYDVLLTRLLQPGDYTVSVMAYSNFANGPNLSNGFQNTGSFGGRSQSWAFDVLGVDTATQVGAVPEPGTWAMMLMGFGATGFAMRRRKKVLTLASA
jgi:hypothetical protein